VYFQAIYSRPGTQRFYLWNYTRSRWDLVRTQEVRDGQIERYMEAFAAPAFLAEHVNAQGDVRLRIEAPLGGTFTCYADYCAVTAR
jgi:hypothetical protein